MEITRREFLGYTAGAIGAMGLTREREVHHSSGPKLDQWRIVCSRFSDRTGESSRGYRSAIPPQRSQDPRIASVGRDSLLIMPQLLWPKANVAAGITQTLREGATVIVESGAGFASHWMFHHHRGWLRERLHIRVAAPVDLWADRSTSRPPYIEFTWPHRATIRDFSRVVPPAEQPGEIIAWADGQAVAFRRKVGNGTLIYLGSPVGPALWAGDVEARRWFYAVAHAA